MSNIRVPESEFQLKDRCTNKSLGEEQFCRGVCSAIGLVAAESAKIGCSLWILRGLGKGLGGAAARGRGKCRARGF